MAFSYSSGVITQTGTDTDLSGLSGLTGVTVFAGSRKTFYEVDSVRIQFDGTCSINPNTECIIFKGTLANPWLSLGSSGNLTVGSTRRETADWCVCDRGGNRFGGGGSVTDVVIDANTGTFNWLGGSLVTGSSARFGSGANISGGVITVLGSSNATQAPWLYLDNCTISSLIIGQDDGITSSGTLTLNTPPSSESGLVLLDDYGYSNIYNGGAVSSSNLNVTGSLLSRPYGFIWEIINLADAKDKVIQIINKTSPGTSATGNMIGQNVDISFIDTEGSPVNNVKVYAVDSDSGNRNTNAAIDTQCGFTCADNQEYIGVSVGGVVPTLKLFSNVTYCVDPQANSATISDNRFGNDFIATFGAFSYNQIVDNFTADLNSVSNVELQRTRINDDLITESTKVTVDAYTELETPQKLYDRAKSYLYDNYKGETSTIVSRNGETIDAGSYDVVIDATASQAFDLTGNTITIHADTFTGNITTTGTMTLSNGALVLGTITSSNINQTTLPYSITGLQPNSRVQIYGIDTTTEVFNDIVTGTTLNGTYQEGVQFTTGDSVRVRVTNVQGLVAYQEFESTVVASSTGWNVLVSQSICQTYAAWGLSGSTITKFNADYIDDEVDLVINSNYEARELGAWWKYNLYTEQGLREFFGGITFEDEANLKINSSIVDIKLDNTTSGNVFQTDNRRIYREDLTRPVKEPTTGGGGIDVEWRSPVTIANTNNLDINLNEIKANQEVINNGVKKASLIIPHTDDLP